MRATSPNRRGSCSYAVFLVLTLFFPGLLISSAYAGNAGSFLLAYPLPVPTKQYEVIETTYPLPAPEGYALAISATPGEFAPATFVLRAGEALSGVNVQASALTGPGTIPAGNVDVRWVKTWYQAGTGDCSCDVGTFLIPELLLKDDALINTDRVAQKSYLRATVSGAQQYVDITTVGATLPAGAIVQDAATLQPSSMAVNTNKQVWLTVQVPTGTPAGAYTGTITVSATGKPATTLSLSVTVLPFVLSPSLIEQSIYYRGLLNASCSTLDSECKTQTQMNAEFINMRDHGIRYPMMYDHYYSTLMTTRLSMMESAGFPKDKIYQIGDGLKAIGAYDQTTIATVVTQWNSFASAHGWGQVYTHAIDEATGTTFDSELTSLQTIHANGGKVVTALPDTATAVRQPSISQVDTAVLYGYFATASDVAATRALLPSGGKVFIYGSPFTDKENPDYVRKHYGFALLLKNYDGIMNYAYQDLRKGGWNDFTAAATGDRGFAWTYPTSNGVVDTLQWEGYREAVDDIRYASTLAGLKGWTTAQLISYLQGLSTLAPNPDSSNVDPTATRQTIINEILATLSGGGCSYGINPGSASPPASGGTSSVSVSAGTTCAWTASTNASWLGVMSGSSGSGNGATSYSVAANSGAARMGTLTVAGQTFTVTQAANCAYVLSAPSASAAANGGSGALNVTAAAGCAWTAQSNAAWISVVSGASGSGNGSVSYSVAANTGAARSGTLTVAGQTFTINQAAVVVTCTNSLSATNASVAAGGGSGTLNVTATAGCAWTAQSNATAWISVVSGASGSGNGSVSYSVAANTGAARSGTLTVAGQTFTINQAAVVVTCTNSLSATNASVAAGGGSGTLNVAATAGCAWTAQSNATAWISVVSGASGSGNGSVSYSVAANTGAARSGTLTVAGQTFTINQAAVVVSCVNSLSPTSASVTSGGGAGSVSVGAGSTCPWTAISNSSWIKITYGANGRGSGNATYSVATNSGAARSGTLTIGGQTFTVNQAAGNLACTSSLNQTSANVSPGGAAGSVSVSAGSTCAWTAVSNSSWITITAGANGSGTGTVSYSASANTGAARSGTMTIAGQTFTVSQRKGR